MRILIFHTGSIGAEYYQKFFELLDNLNCNLIGFTSMDAQNYFNKIGNYTIYPAKSIITLKYDKILIGDINEEIINSFKEIFLNLNVPAEKISGILWILQQVMIKKYEDVQDSAIQETLKYWENHELSVFNQHTEENPHTYDEVFFDEKIGLPYINFATIENKIRRMYYPKDSEFYCKDNGKKYVLDILREQLPTSPHLYIKDNHKVEEGDVLIDAGVCEGNFSLRYADICSKIYLFEPDKRWFESLYYSFKYCWNKVEFIPKGVSNLTSADSVTLDDAVNVPLEVKFFSKWTLKEQNLRHCAARKKF